LEHIVSSAGKEVFSRVLAAELAPRNIRVICIRPLALTDASASGSYTEDLFEPAAAADGLSVEEWVGGLAQGTILKRLPTLSGVAETAAFLASDRAGAMTGTVANPTSGAIVG
jgi:NAD(P)-dependent dehydrogenase (short-subunit alcohol dehydrogenase family)